MNTTIQSLHAVFCRETEQQLRLGLGEFQRELGWASFVKAGFTEADLLLVVRYLKRKIKSGDRRDAALKWSNCIGDLIRFEDDLQMARGEQRNAKPPPTPRETVLRALRPVATQTPITAPARPVSEFISALRKAAG